MNRKKLVSKLRAPLMNIGLILALGIIPLQMLLLVFGFGPNPTNYVEFVDQFRPGWPARLMVIGIVFCIVAALIDKPHEESNGPLV